MSSLKERVFSRFDTSESRYGFILVRYPGRGEYASDDQRKAIVYNKRFGTVFIHNSKHISYKKDSSRKGEDNWRSVHGKFADFIRLVVWPR